MVSSGKASLVALVLALAGCGGGGGDGGSGGGSGGGGAGGPAPTLALFAGSMEGRGSVDGIGTAARFDRPFGVATDSDGSVYVVDAQAHTVRKITPAGVISTVAGSPYAQGSADGAGATARFNTPTGVTTDSGGNVYVADTFNHTIRKITPAGVVSTIAGSAGTPGGADGTGAAARFNFPHGLATDGGGNVYVADGENSTIRKITPAGVVSTIAGTAGAFGSTDGTGAAARFKAPLGVATDGGGNVYVADFFDNTIRKITPAGVVSTIAGSTVTSGTADGTGTAALFDSPAGIATDGSGNVYVADTLNHTIRKITPAGVVSTIAGTAGTAGSADGAGAAARFNFPEGLAVDAGGNVYVADSSNHTVRKVVPTAAVSTIAGTPESSGSADGAGAAARFRFPFGVATDGSGNVYAADSDNDAIRKITPAGVVSTFAPNVPRGNFFIPMGVAADGKGNIYAANTGQHTIRKITPSGAVSGLAGFNGMAGSADATGLFALFNSPIGLATDSGANVYVADSGNHTIRKITPAGTVSTLAGTAGTAGSADGTGAAARFNGPSGVATDGGGNVYVADSGNNTIRKVTPAGTVSTLAGTAGTSGSADGTGAAARFAGPLGVATDSGGNVYVADTGNHTIRKITPVGVVSTIVGVAGSSGFEAGPLPGIIGFPSAIAVSGSLLYFTDYHGVAVVSNRP